MREGKINVVIHNQNFRWVFFKKNNVTFFGQKVRFLTRSKILLRLAGQTSFVLRTRADEKKNSKAVSFPPPPPKTFKSFYALLLCCVSKKTETPDIEISRLGDKTKSRWSFMVSPRFHWQGAKPWTRHSEFIWGRNIQKICLYLCALDIASIKMQTYKIRRNFMVSLMTIWEDL